MKLVRFGERGRERPGLIDPDGAIRDLSSMINDLAGRNLSRESLQRIAAADIERLPRGQNVVGMGRQPPRFLRAGDRVTVGIDRPGSQSQSVVE